VKVSLPSGSSIVPCMNDYSSSYMLTDTLIFSSFTSSPN
jgi:hypothetical protein